jgi:hypothetical protein
MFRGGEKRKGRERRMESRLRVKEGKVYEGGGAKGKEGEKDGKYA